EVKLDPMGNFKVMARDTTSEDVLVVTNKSSNVIMLKYYNDTTRDFLISSQSTAMSLLLLYPILKPIDISTKKVLADEYKVLPEFINLVNQIDLVNQQEGKLFDSTNFALINLINYIVGKEISPLRYKPNSSNQILADPGPI